MPVPLTINNLKWARRLYYFSQLYRDAYPKWPLVKAAMEREFPGMVFESKTYPSFYGRLCARYGINNAADCYAKHVDARPLSELFPDGVPDIASVVVRHEPYEGEMYKGMAQNGATGDVFPSQTLELPPLPEIIIGTSERTNTQPAATKDALLSLLSKRHKLAELESMLGLPRRVLLAYIDEIKDEGYGVSLVDDEAWIEKAAVLTKNEHFEKWDGATIIRFGKVADTHLCNKYQQITHLRTFYKICKQREIPKVYHSGDMSDGFYHNRPEHVYELFRRGLDEQSEYIIGEYPQEDGIETEFIEGNHDFTHQRNGGASIGRIIGAARKDMKFLGYGKARVWITPKCSMDLVHPLDGKAYALSYRLQKNIDALQGGTKPNMLFFGHYHAYCNIFYRNIHAYMLPGFQAQNPWATLKSMMTQVGGIIYEVRVAEDGEVLSVKQELIPFYVMKENDY